MSVKELLTPRFELIEPYPGSTQPVGTITMEDAAASYFRKYPANFRELFWHEKRDPCDMPKYLRHISSKKARRALRFIPLCHHGFRVEFEGGRTRLLSSQWIPVEQAEF